MTHEKQFELTHYGMNLDAREFGTPAVVTDLVVYHQVWGVTAGATEPVIDAVFSEIQELVCSVCR